MPKNVIFQAFSETETRLMRFKGKFYVWRPRRLDEATCLELLTDVTFGTRLFGFLFDCIYSFRHYL